MLGHGLLTLIACAACHCVVLLLWCVCAVHVLLGTVCNCIVAGSIGNAEWTGVELRGVLLRAGEGRASGAALLRLGCQLQLLQPVGLHCGVHQGSMQIYS